ncbi:uncharacterized protein BDR25DRAFT_378060 [Lindgomyces ingoldianus]|uniref:Uncharacterized protein n=1 Tax=Lindgomyces ingoldianus TaxID=673940 RepID=A0ACB6QH95_9PLEO|nr:uncharacterized protein BDR25DRAFT_378060 [Lindgomyces ingoldianus]KAF2465880.1 hypothetical protein BDR25DRAFT_378060 [Lindgomyces ingoldianus]
MANSSPPATATAAICAPSPADSEKTVVPFTTPPASEQMAVPDSASSNCPGKALFSTDLNRRPPRTLKPPYPPVIARGYADQKQAVADYAHFWRSKYPDQYQCFFPLCGWTINDLWDDWDIHVDSPSFLEQVLVFITWENTHHARGYAHVWATANKDRFLNIVCGDINELQDPAGELATVDKVFVSGETNLFPHVFLWHVFNIMRVSIHNVNRKQHEEAQKHHETTAAETATKKAENITVPPEAVAVLQPARASAGSVSKHQAVSGSVAKATPPMQPPAIPLPVTHPSIFAPAAPTIRGPIPPFRQNAPLRGGYHNQPAGGSMSINPTMPTIPPMPPVHMNQPQVRYPKNRNMRSASGSYIQGIPMPQSSMPGGWAENVPVPHTGQPSRQTSGAMSAVHSPRYSQPVPISQSVMHSMNPMAPFPPNPTFGPPMSGPNQMPYTPMMNPAMMVQQTTPFGSPAMEPGQQNYVYGSSTPRGVPIGDVTNNNSQYPFIGPPRMDQRGNMPRRGSRADKQQGLYNPYGSDRPDFSHIPAQPTSRKTGRNSFSNQPNRGRKASIGSYNRNAYGQNPDPGDFNFQRQGARQPEVIQDSPYGQRGYKDEVDFNITQDRERGCDEGFIGDKNDFVDFLWVVEFPVHMKDDAIRRLFEEATGVKVTQVRMLTDKRHMPIAYVHFNTPADAKKGLKVNGQLVGGKSIIVRVPKHFYMVKDPNSKRQWTANYYEPRQPGPQSLAKGKHRTAHGAQNILENDRLPNAPGPAYSPQDARSDLQRRTSQDLPMMRGSPEARKSKKQPYTSPTKVKIFQEDPGEINVKESASTALTTKDKEEFVMVQSSCAYVADKVQTPAQQPTIAEAPSITVVEKKTPVTPRAEETHQVDTETQSVTNSLSPTQEIPQQIEGIIKADPPKRALPPPPEPTNHTPKSPPTNERLDLNNSDHETTVEGSLAKPPTPVEDPPPASPLQDELDRDIQVRDSEEASDDDPKNDVSFHSAKESLSDSEKHDEAKATALPGTDGQPQDITGAPTLSTSAENELGEQANDTPSTMKSPAIEQKALAITGALVVETPREPTSDVTQAPASLEKKPGPKQTESLFPMAKSKNQKKKERKEKEKAKAKSKAKTAEKSTSSNKATEGNAGKDKGASSLATTASEAGTIEQEVKFPSAPPQSSRCLASVRGSNFAAHMKDVGVLVTGDKVDVMGGSGESVTDPGQLDMEVEDTVLGGKESNPSTKSKDDTLRLLLQTSLQCTPLSPPKSSASAQSHKSTAMQKPTPASAPGEPSAKDMEVQEEAKKKKAIRDKVAIPKLNLTARKPSPSGTGPASDTTLHSKFSSTVPSPVDGDDKAGVTEGQILQMKQALPHMLRANEKVFAESKNVEDLPAKSPSGSVSAASSDTVRPEPFSPSPTAADFFTPMQTPSTLPNQAPTTLPPFEQAQAKKSKNKKKKKKASVIAPLELSGPQTSSGSSRKRVSILAEDADIKLAENVSEEENAPFMDQIQQVDVLKGNNRSRRKSTVSYYPVQPAAPSPTILESEKNLEFMLQEVKAYQNDKETKYQPEAEKQWEAQRNLPESPRKDMDFQEVTDLIKGKQIHPGFHRLATDDGVFGKVSPTPDDPSLF